MKKKGGILLLLSQFIISTVLLPFFASSVHADTISGQDAVGTDVSYTSVDSIQYQGTSSGLLVYWNTGTVHIQYKLKKAVIGVVRLQFDIEYFTRENNQWTTSTVTEIVNAKFNGDTFVYEFNLNSFGPLMYTWMDTDHNNTHIDNPLRGWSTSILSSNVTFYDDLSDLQDVIDILQDIYSDTTNLVGLSGDQLSELQTILQNCQAMGITLTDIDGHIQDTNDLLDFISQYRQWNFPIESYNFISYWFSNNREFVDYYRVNNYYTFPKFKMLGGQYIINNLYVPTANSIIDLVLLIRTSSGIKAFSYSPGLSLNRFENISYFADGEGKLNYLRHYTLTATTTGNKWISYPDDCEVVPIYCYIRLSPSHISTDFAIQFGLSNQLLDDLHLVAQGTQQSNSSADNLEDNNDQMASDMDSLATIENGYNQDFNNQLQNIDFSNPIQQNSGLLPAANFVISVFNGLISNNPFSTLIIIVCILLIGKKVIGK